MREYLAMSSRQNAGPETMLDALRVVGLADAVSTLEDGLDTRIVHTGWPLSVTEVMQLKLAAAILAEPRLLVLGELYDMLPENSLRTALDQIQEGGRSTVVLFSRRNLPLGCTSFMHLGAMRQRTFPSAEIFESEVLAPTEAGADIAARLAAR